jgi:acyl dehydratase
MRNTQPTDKPEVRIAGQSYNSVLNHFTTQRSGSILPVNHRVFQETETMALEEALKDLQAKVGEEIHCSDWETISQEMIDEFARATGDLQWIHVDPVRAAKESPYGTTIAHGYFTLSLYPRLRGLVDESKPLFPGATNVINYGINKLRFPNAVKAGSKIRARCELVSAEEVKGSIELIEKYIVEIEGEPKPACIAECIMRLYF